MPRHTQAMMDLGATVCTTAQACMLSAARWPSYCVARAQGQPGAISRQNPQTQAQQRVMVAAAVHHAQRIGSWYAVFLVQRPTPGVWAGLYSLPMYDSREALMSHACHLRSTRLCEDAACL